MNFKNIVLICMALSSVTAFQPSYTVPKRHNFLKSTNELYTSYYVPPGFDKIHNKPSEKIINTEPISIQGGSLKTWSYSSNIVKKIQVNLFSEGRPFDANIELWNGPNNTPIKMRAYVENGKLQPFTTVIEAPNSPNTIAIRNVGQMELPFMAQVDANNVQEFSKESNDFLKTIQGGALKTFQFNPFVDSVAVFIKSNGYPLNCRIEMLQGPNNNKQVIELYSEDGLDRPFYCVLQTPDFGNVVRVINTSPIEFPMIASVVPNSIQLN